MSTRDRPPVWMWFNILSLDAPLIALVWQDYLARCYPTMLLPQGRAVLGLTVWAIYLADRILDVRHPAEPLESPRGTASTGAIACSRRRCWQSSLAPT